MDSDFDFLLIEQHGVFTRAQARTHGVTMSAIRAQLDAHRWRRHAAVSRGETALRYGWLDVAGRPCLVARQVGEVLQRLGWTGQLTSCPDCPTGQ